LLAALTSRPILRIGRYELLDEIASGGMASIHLGRQIGDAGFVRTVAIKRLHPQFARDPGFVAMLLDEARLASRIQHPCVVSPTDVVSSEGELFVVMDYVAGESLGRLTDATHEIEERVSLPIVCRVLVDVLHGLHAAHDACDERGQPLCIVHRDVSPQNILVGVDGRARVIDFGVAKAAVRSQTTREGELKGKLAYMAPEQIQDHEVDRRCDVYAASVVLWEMLAHRPLFRAGSEGALLGKVMEGAVVPPSRHDSRIPADLDRIVVRGLARDPEARFATAGQLAAAIEAAVGLAAESEVAAWVRRVRGAEIDQRSAQFARVATVATAAAKTLDYRPWIGIGVIATGAAALFWLWPRPAPAPAATTATIVSQIPLPAPPLASSTPLPALAPSMTANPAPRPLPRKVDCSTPTFVDAQGVRRVKRECL
jgi:serine/threonine-protein kinase